MQQDAAALRIVGQPAVQGVHARCDIGYGWIRADANPVIQLLFRPLRSDGIECVQQLVPVEDYRRC